MSRLTINFPWIWNSLSGKQPAQSIDDDFSAVPAGDITIRTKVKAASYSLINDDEYSFILCLPTANMSLTLPSSPSTGYSFFFSDQSTTKTVQLIGSVTVDGVPTLNPTFPTGTAKGGLVVFDGSTWSSYSKLFLL